jgi:hypothetical protein
MLNGTKSLFHRIVLVSLVLYSLTLAIYFIKFYEPFEPIQGIDNSTNEMFKSWHNYEIKSFLIISILVCIVVSLIILIVYNEIEFYFKPVKEINARLKSKEMTMGGSVSPGGNSYYGYTYRLVFETEEGEEMSFMVLPVNYMTVFQGNIGILKYKKGITDRFVGFDITSIE